MVSFATLHFFDALGLNKKAANDWANHMTDIGLEDLPENVLMSALLVAYQTELPTKGSNFSRNMVSFETFAQSSLSVFPYLSSTLVAFRDLIVKNAFYPISKFTSIQPSKYSRCRLSFPSSQMSFPFFIYNLKLRDICKCLSRPCKCLSRPCKCLSPINKKNVHPRK